MSKRQYDDVEEDMESEYDESSGESGDESEYSEESGDEEDEEEEEDVIQEFYPKYIKKTEINKTINKMKKDGYIVKSYIETKKNGEKGVLITFSK